MLSDQNRTQNKFNRSIHMQAHFRLMFNIYHALRGYRGWFRGCKSFYSRAIDWACVAFRLSTSLAVWVRTQRGQQQVANKSPTKPPSMPCCSRTFPRVFAMKNKLAKGTRVTKPHIRQSSPTTAEFLPCR